MTTEEGPVKYSNPACSFCGAKEEDCDILLHAENDKTFICDQCVKALIGYLKANPGRKHLRYLPKRNRK